MVESECDEAPASCGVWTMRLAQRRSVIVAEFDFWVSASNAMAGARYG